MIPRSNPDRDAPPAVRVAVAAVSGRVVCLEGCWSAIEIRFGEHGLELHHPYADCVCATRPDGPEANELAEHVLDELARYIVVSDYGEPLPISRWGAVA